MKDSSKIVLLAVIFAALLGGFLLFRGSGQPGQETERFSPAQVQGSFVRGQEAPDVAFTDFEGNNHNLSDFAGKAVVLDFWAGWCRFCIAEMPELQKAQEQYGEELVIVGVHRTDTESKSTGEKFAQEVGAEYLLVTDPDGSLYRAAGGFGMPVAVFINKEGVVTEIKSGPKTADEIEEKISRIMNNE